MSIGDHKNMKEKENEDNQRFPVRIGIRISEDMHAKIKKVADNNGTTVGALIRFWIAQNLDKKK